MDLRYILTLEKALQDNKSSVETVSPTLSFLTVYMNKKHLRESMNSLRGLGSKLEKFDETFDLIVVVGDGKGETMFYGKDELLEAWEQYKTFVTIESKESKKYVEPVAVYSGVWLDKTEENFDTKDSKYKRIEGWDNF